MVLGAVSALPAGARPRLAGTLPHVERAMLEAVQDAGLDRQVVRLAADTNGFVTAGAVVLVYPSSGPDALGELQTAVGRLLRATFTRVRCLDELDVTAFEERPGPFDGNRRDVGFTVAAGRHEVERFPGRDPGELVRSLTRAWVSPEFPHGGPAVLPPPAARGKRSVVRSALEQVQELPRRVAGMVFGGVVDGVVYRGRPGRRAVALTFDDGPEPLYTPLLLDTLERLGLRATFFLVGQRVEQYPYFARAIRLRGHEVAVHGYSHVSLARLPAPELRRELERARTAVELHAGVRPAYLRPPGGRYSSRAVQIASQLGLITVLWTDSPGDYGALDPEQLQARLLSRVYAGGILLLHQGTPNTLRALPEVSRVLRRLGYHVTTVGGLLSGE